MKEIIKATFSQLALVLNDSSYRALLYKPFKKGIKAFFIIFIIWAIVSAVGCQLGDFFFDGGAVWIFMFANILALIFFPPLLAFIYFSLFCENEYCAIAQYCFQKQKGPDAKPEVYLSSDDPSFMMILFCVVLLTGIVICSLIGSFFFPLLGLFVAGLILFWDFSSYFFICTSTSYKKRIRFLYENLFSVIVISIFLACICLIPFSILFLYPLGVGICTHYIMYRVEDTL